MSSAPNSWEELKNRARAGDSEALQELRDRGFFKQRKAARKGYAVSHAQRRLWIVDQMLKGSDVAGYNMPVAFRLQGPLDVAAFRRALEVIAARHESLRTTFASLNGELRQFVHDDVGFRLEESDLSGESDPEESARRRAEAEAVSPFNLEKGPLLRAKLVRLATGHYVFLFNIHHIVCDVWSQSVMVRELSTLYQAFTKGQKNPLPPLKIQYKDYAAWQDELLKGEAEGHRAYWHRKLMAPLPVLNFPADYPRPPFRTYSAKVIGTTLDQGLVERVRRSSASSEATLFTFLVAVLKVLLYRYTCQQDLILGCPAAGRDHPDLADQIGFYVNTVVLRDQLNGSDTFREVLKKVKQTVTEALEHQTYPFDKLVNELNLERDASRSPLFDVSVNLNTLASSEEVQFHLEGVTVSGFDNGFSMAKVDLSFDFSEILSVLYLTISYNTDLFREEKIRSLAEHFKQLAKSTLENFDQPIGCLRMLAEQERKQLLDEFNSTRVGYPQDKTIMDLFEEQVGKTPSNVALVYEDRKLTYRELNAKSNQLAHHLRALGVGADTLVGICAERSLEMIVGLLGILKAGGAYVPFDLACPKERLAFMLKDARVPVLLTEEKLAGEFIDQAAQLVYLDRDWEVIAQGREENPALEARSASPAYVIYTSGSTGQPKGVLVSHANVTRLFAATQQWFHFDQRDVWTLFHSYAFDFSVWELWGALLHGGRLVVVPHWISRSHEAFYSLLTAEGVTVLNQTPSAFRQLTEAEEILGQAGDLSLRLVIFGGEALDVQSLKPWWERHGDQRPQLVNMYGITETTVHVTSRPLSMDDLKHPASVIGWPIPDVQVYVLDQEQQPVPVGVIGEIHVGGAGLARGYLNRPELTAERFVPNPFSRVSGARLYRTGDLAQFLPDGSLEFLGRRDYQVKLRGYRIELGEIETALGQHPQLFTAVVLLREDKPGEKRLVAYFVPAGEHCLSAQALRSFLQEKLPDYMIPAIFVELKELPQTPNGKVDRQALPEPDRARPDLESAFVAPRTAVERALARVFAETLGVEQVGAGDHFFELGGDSLLATQVVSRVRELFRVEVPLPRFFQASTVADLAEVLQNSEESEGRLEKIALALEKLQSMSEEEKKTFLENRAKAQNQG